MRGGAVAVLASQQHVATFLSELSNPKRLLRGTLTTTPALEKATKNLIPEVKTKSKSKSGIKGTPLTASDTQALHEYLTFIFDNLNFLFTREWDLVDNDLKPVRVGGGFVGAMFYIIMQGALFKAEEALARGDSEVSEADQAKQRQFASSIIDATSMASLQKLIMDSMINAGLLSKAPEVQEMVR